MKKEYLSQAAKELSEKSDTELVDTIAETTNSVKQELAKAILGQRFKKVVQFLTEVVIKNTKTTDFFNKIMVF